jgi:dihydrofolate reductase
VIAQMTLSLDGCYAGPRTDVAGGADGDWAASPEAAAFFRITRWVVDAMAWRERLGFEGGEESPDSEILRESFEAAGAYVMGRRMADGGEIPWGEEPPFHAPVFVVTNRPRETLQRQGGTSFTYVTDGLEAAVERARTAAGAKDVAVAGGGSLLRQVLAAGLLDQLDLHIAPVVVGDGMRLLDPAGIGLAPFEGIELEPTRVVASPQVTHVRYRVLGRAPLGGDERTGDA